jgi:hypothetical protein
VDAITNEFGHETVRRLVLCLKENHSAKFYGDESIYDFISGYCVSAFADLCEEYGVQIK